jgi:magnesium-transporting ATPase (P-type)
MTSPQLWSAPSADLLRRLDSSTDGLSAAAAARRLVEVGPNRLHDRPRSKAFLLLLRQFTSPIVLLLTGAALLSGLVHDSTDAYIILLWVMNAGAVEFRTGWFIESVISATLIVLVVRTRARLIASLPSTSLLAATATVICVTVVLPFTPMAAALGFAAVPTSLVLMIVAIVVAYVASAECAKQWFYRRVSL